jgi:hypothetical protein
MMNVTGRGWNIDRRKAGPLKKGGPGADQIRFFVDPSPYRLL